MPKGTKAIIIAVGALVLLVLALSAVGSPLPPPFHPVVELDSPACASATTRMGVIADSQSKRLLFLDARDQVTGIVDLASTSTPIDTVCNVCVCGDSVYVAGTKAAGDTSLISSDHVLRFSPTGMYQGSVLSITRASDAQSSSPAITGLCPGEGCVYACVSGITPKGAFTDLGMVTVVELSHSHRPKTLFTRRIAQTSLNDTCYDHNSDTLCSVDLRGLLTTRHGEETERTLPELGTVLSAAIDQQGQVLACVDQSKAVTATGGNRQTLLSDFAYTSVSSNGSVLAACDRTNGVVVMRDGTSPQRAITTVGLAPLLLVRSTAVWCSGLLLVVLGVALMVRNVRTAVRTGETSKLGSMLGIAAVSAAIVSGVMLFMNNMTDRAIEVRSNEIDTLADTLILSCPTELRESVTLITKDRNAMREGRADVLDALPHATEYLYSLCESASRNDIGLYFNMYGQDSQGIYNVLDFGAGNVFGSAVPKSAMRDQVQEALTTGKVDNSVRVGLNRNDTTIYRLVPILDKASGKPVAVVELGSNLETLTSRVGANKMSVAIALLVTLLVIYLCYSEIRGCGSDLVRSRLAAHDEPCDALAGLARPLTFASTLVTSADAVMIVLIARDMLSSSGVGTGALMLALPVACLRLGMLLGAWLMPTLAARVDPRRLVLGGFAVAVVLSLAVMAAVTCGSFAAYCCSRLALSVPLGMLFALGAMLPTVAKDPDVRDRGARGVSLIGVSGAALGAVAGGYVGALAGNGWVYALAALLATLWIAIFFGTAPKTAKTIHAIPVTQDEGRAKATMSFARSVPVVALLALVMLPAACASGYQSLVFPLYAAGMGLSKMEITNLFVAAQLVVYLLAGHMLALRARMGQRTAAAISVACIGMVFLVAAVNQSLAWVIAGVVIVAICVKFAEAWKIIWAEEGASHGLVPSERYGTMVAGWYGVMLVQPLVMELFASTGGRIAGIALGAFSLICAMGYGIYSQRRGAPTP